MQFADVSAQAHGTTFQRSGQLTALRQPVREAWAGEGLWLLVGHPRSGTTFLGRLLGAHADVAYWEEPGLLFVAQQFLEQLSRLYEHLAVDAGLDTVELNPTASLDQRQASAASLTEARDSAHVQCRSVLHSLQLAFLAKAGKPILLEKTPGQVLALPVAEAVVPAAKIIHIVRDPRDVAASALRWIKREGWPPWLEAGDDPVAVVAEQWVHHVGAGIAAQATQPVFMLHHEDLVNSTRATLNDLLEFLELPWSTRLDDFLARGMGRGLDPSTVRGWHTDLDDADVAIVEGQAGELMASLGYTPIHARSRPAPRRGRWSTRRGGSERKRRHTWPVSRHHDPSIQIVGGGVTASYGFPGGARLLTEDGHVYEFPPGSAPHVGSPAEDARADWAARGRRGARMVGTAQSFDVWDDAGEHYGPYGR